MCWEKCKQVELRLPAIHYCVQFSQTRHRDPVASPTVILDPG